ncbi:MAG: hypothetical protein WC497_00335 [Patescibacteria group bacterium]
MINLPPDVSKAIAGNQKVRIAIARQSHLAFFTVYLHNYIKYPFAPFHDDLFDITERNDNRYAVITAFRGSGKSTILTLSYPLWAIIGRPQKKFVLILGNTMHQAQTYMKHIKSELEGNLLLRRDLGPFQEENNWQAASIVLQKYGARITCASYEQGIRGLRHRQYRPDLIICDDIEDLDSVKTLESRDRTADWFKGEVLPAGDRNTRVFVVGNLLHEDSLIMRLRKEIEEGQFDADYRAYPFLDEAGKAAWPGKFPDQASIDAERRKINDEAAFQREYMLNIIPDVDRVIQKEWIRYYDDLPDEESGWRYGRAGIGVDPALSQRDGADRTAMVAAKSFIKGKELRVYVLPYPVNERLTPLRSIQRAKKVASRVESGRKTPLFVEDVAFQRHLIDDLKKEGYPAIGVPTRGLDKRGRLLAVSQYLENGQVFFPRHGAEILISQLLGFGAERYDDLVDAFTIIVGELFQHPPSPPPTWMNDDDDNDPQIDDGFGYPTDGKPIFWDILNKQF